VKPNADRLVGRAVLCPPFLQFGVLVEIRFGKRKCVFDNFNARLRVARNDYFNDIESEKNIWIIEHSQPSERAARNSLLFFSINGFERPTEVFTRTCFYFDEHERMPVTADNVNLAACATAEIAEQYFVTATLEVSAR